MAKKMEESGGAGMGFVDLKDIDGGEFEIADARPPMREVPRGSAIDKTGTSVPADDAPEGGEAVNCLRAERVIVRFVPHPNSMAENPKHVLYGGMSEASTRTYTVPMLTNGSLKNVLTKAEKDFLEQYMGLEYNALSVHRKTDNFWHNFEVTLGKSDNVLDLSDPNDYIKYKVLLANRDYIAPSLEVMQDRPKASYEYVMVSEGDAEGDTGRRVDLKMRLYMEFGRISEDRRMLLTVIRLMENKVMSRNAKIVTLKGMVQGYIDSDPRALEKTLTDPLLRVKSVILECVEEGQIVIRGDYYYLRDGNVPMCGPNQEPTLSNAARWLGLPKNAATFNGLQMALKEGV